MLTFVLPLAPAMDLTGVEVASMAVMSMSLSSCSSCAGSTPNLTMLVSNIIPASAVSVSPAVDALLTCQYSGGKFVSSLSLFLYKYKLMV